MTEGAWGAVGGAARLSVRTWPSSTLGGREEVFTRLSCGPRGITDGYRDHSFTSRFHGSNAGAASAVVRPKQRRAIRRSRQAPQSVHVDGRMNQAGDPAKRWRKGPFRRTADMEPRSART